MHKGIKSPLTHDAFRGTGGWGKGGMWVLPSANTAKEPTRPLAPMEGKHSARNIAARKTCAHRLPFHLGLEEQTSQGKNHPRVVCIAVRTKKCPRI
jgi:hypothetical protein